MIVYFDKLIYYLLLLDFGHHVHIEDKISCVIFLRF